MLMDFEERWIKRPCSEQQVLPDDRSPNNADRLSVRQRHGRNMQLTTETITIDDDGKQV